MINKLSSIMARSDNAEFEFSDYQNEKEIITTRNYTYIEHWGLCTRVTTDEFLNVFKSIHAFLNRWKSKQLLLNEIGKAFEQMKKMNFKDTSVFEYELGNNEFIRMIIYKYQLNMETQAYLNSLELPLHIIDGE